MPIDHGVIPKSPGEVKGKPGRADLWTQGMGKKNVKMLLGGKDHGNEGK